MEVNNKNELSANDFVLMNTVEESPKVTQTSWSAYRLFWSTFGYDMENPNLNITPVSSGQFPKVELKEFGLDQKQTLGNFKSVEVANPKTQAEAILKRLSSFFGRDYKFPEKTLQILLSFLEYAGVAKSFENFLTEAEKLRMSNLEAIENRKPVDFMQKASVVFLLGNDIYTEMMNEMDHYIEKEVTESKLSEEEVKEKAENLKTELPAVFKMVKDECTQKTNILNTQDVIDVIRLGAYEMELDKPEEERDYVKGVSSDTAVRFYHSHTDLAKHYENLTVEEKILFDEGYEFKGDLDSENFHWVKSAWEKPGANEPLVYKLHIGYAQPGGDVREGTLIFDLSHLDCGHLSKEEAIHVFHYLTAAVNASTSINFEKEYTKHQSGLEKIVGIDGALLIKEAASKFRQDVDPLLFSITSHLGHSEEVSGLCESRKEEFEARANFVRLVKSRGLGWKQQEMNAFNSVFRIPEFRQSFQEFVAIIAEKMRNNEYPPFGENHGGLDKKFMKMQEALNEQPLQLLETIGPYLNKMYNSVTIGQND